ncbi:MAG: sigma-70 family RNA polymerase sigma factor [Acidobacteria bacterium]|nr:sigma-70 family RNA polymerase sigma factor [Acidobacteriota bacterium]
MNELSLLATDRPTDEELARLVAAGQVEVFAQLYVRYYARAFRLAWAMTGRREAAEELTQEIFLRAWQKAGQFRGESSFSTWFYRLATHCCLNFRKRLPSWAHESLEGVEQSLQTDAMNQIEANVQRQEIQGEVHRALLSLKPKWRLIVILKDIEGLSYEEIAERMDCSTGTVASRLNRSRALLARKLEHLRGRV